MGLSKRFSFKGLDIDHAYFRLKSFNWRGNVSLISLDVYADRRCARSGIEPVTSVSFQIPLDLNNLQDSKTIAYNEMRSLIYSEIKKIPLFEGAVDV